MNKIEWREMVKEIYFQHLAPKMRPMRKMFHPFEWFEGYPYHTHEVIRATRMIRFIEEQCAEDQDVLTVFNSDHVKNMLQELQNGADFNRRHLTDSGLIDTIDEFYTDIIAGMEVSDIPDADFNALREAGSPNPQAEIRLCIMRLQKRGESTKFINDSPSFRNVLERAAKNLERKKHDYDQKIEGGNNREGPPRRWFKGIGTIGRGTILSLVDLSLIAGWWPILLSQDTTIVGGVVSLITGVGDISTGIGEMRGE